MSRPPGRGGNGSSGRGPGRGSGGTTRPPGSSAGPTRGGCRSIAWTLTLITLLALLTGCEPAAGDPNPGRKPAPGPDPSALASVGRDQHSALLHVDWDGYREFSIRYKDQDGVHDLRQKPNKVGSKWGGFFEVTVVLDMSRPVGLLISAGPYRATTEAAGRAHCWIRHNGVVVDEDRRGSGNVLCAASNVGR